ncbi:MAG: sigma 54-interacting transcriptional regulator [Firmicutes bacterium]|nr:sigma 54-interacting transcriptional regulator [Bacillota bacterium]
MYLLHKTGVHLLLQGEKHVLPPGYAWDERNVGTSAHSLCMHLKRPVQLLGLEYYCEAVASENIIISAAPILDKNDEAIACVALRQELANEPWEKRFQFLYSHTIGLVRTFAMAIGDAVKLRESHNDLESANNHLKTTRDSLAGAYETLEATLSLMDEGIVMIDRTGKIENINREGAKIFKLRPDQMESRNIKDFLSRQSSLMSVIEKGKRVNLEETISSGRDEENYLVSVCPILNPNSRQVYRAVLRFNHIETINALVTKRSGAMSSYSFDDIIGEANIIKNAVTTARRFATSQENILLTGESGTGKEIFAHAIHNDYRPRGPFIAVNCAAIPRNLIESELFGYEGGSFTGAERSGRPGKIELANGGTLFLDEIGDMPFELQAVLLRVLENKRVMRIGGSRYRQVDFRLIAATNRDLYQMVKGNLFREDFYYRLTVLTINLPPLRERGNDIELLSNYFIENYCRRIGRRIPKLSPATKKIINNYQWPGNIRQLENAMIYAVNITKGDVIEPENLPSHVVLDSVPAKTNGEVTTAARTDEKSRKLSPIKDSEKSIIEATIIQSRYNVATAARTLNISKSSMYRKLKEYNIEF